MIGDQDPYLKNCIIHELFYPSTNPKVVRYNEGHKFPRQLTDDNFSVLKSFFEEQYRAKYASRISFRCDCKQFNFTNL